jgi:hypothetical protein
MTTPLRTKPWDDYDARRDPKTTHFCARCQKDIKPGQPVRWVHLINGGMTLLHPASEADYVSDAGELGSHPVGLDCARKLGLEWSVVAPEFDAAEPFEP